MATDPSTRAERRDKRMEVVDAANLHFGVTPHGVRFCGILPVMIALVPVTVVALSAIAADLEPRWEIVLLDLSAPSLRGAQELQTTLQKCSGKRLEIVKAPTPGTMSIRLRRDDKLAEEEYWIRSDSHGVSISGGGKRGLLYGCTGFLQDVLGCRWFTAEIELTPKLAKLSFPGLNIRERPAFEYREPFFTEAFDRDWAARNRCNGNAMRLDDSTGGKIAYGRFVHTFAELVPPEKYFRDHPEYFSLVDGKRRDGYAQLCLTNPDVLAISIAKVREWIADRPDATIFSVSQNDTYLQCECDNCRAVESEEGSPAGPLLRFVNRVAEAIERDHPNVLIDTLAYQWSEKPPLREKPRKNVRIRLAPIGACFSHPLNGCEKNKIPLANLQSWSRITNRLYIWHYCTNFAHYLQPLPCLDEIAGDLRLFRNLGVVGVFDEGAYPPGGCGDMAELKSYVLARLMWNPDLPVRQVVDEFLKGVYGEAAPMLQAWLDLTHQPAREAGVHAGIYDPPSAPYFSQDLLERGRKLFDAAEWKTRDNPTALRMVRKARLGLQYLEFMRTAPDDPLRAERAKALAAAIREFGVQQTSEGRSAEQFLRSIGQ